MSSFFQPDGQDQVLEDTTNPASTVAASDGMDTLRQELERTKSQLASVLGNSNVVKVLQSNNAGQDIAIIPLTEYVELKTPKQQAQQQAPAQPEPDLETMTNKEFLKYAREALAKDVSQQVVNQFDPLVKEVSGELSSLKKYVVDDANTRQTEIARKKIEANPDMKNYVQDMRTIATANPGLDLDELYLLAKKRKGHVDPAVSSGERPTSGVAKPKVVKDANGRVDIKSLLNATTSSVFDNLFKD